MTEAVRGTVIFDLDGTLVDSAPDLAAALDIVLNEMGLSPEGLDGTRALIGHGISALVKGALARQGRGGQGPELDWAIERFTEIYGGGLAVRSTPYPGAGAALDALAVAGWRLVVCTNKREALARGVLDALGLLPHFALVAGPDTFGAAKPDAAALLGALPAGKGPAVVVGDSAIDVTAARAVGLPVIVVAWGYAPGPAIDLGGDAVATSFVDVPPLIEAITAS